MSGLVKKIIQRIALGSECLLNWYPIIKDEIKDETFAILDMDDEFSDFCVFSKEKLLFTRLLSFGRPDLSRKDRQEHFAEEIEATLKACRRENIGPVFNKVVFTGAVPNENLKSILAERFSLEAVSRPAEIEGLTFSQDAKTTLEQKEGVSFSSLIGLALDPTRPLMDFLPLGLKKARSARIKRKELTLTGMLILLIVILGTVILLEKMHAKTLLLERLNAQFVKLEEKIGGLKKEDVKIKLIKSRIAVPNSAIEILREIYKVTPQEIYLAALVFEEGKSLSLRGTARSMSDVFRFVKALEELPVFREVKTKYVTKRKLKGKNFTDFEITCPVVRE